MLWDMCTQQPLGHCWQDYFWQYRVFTDSMSKQGERECLCWGHVQRADVVD